MSLILDALRGGRPQPAPRPSPNAAQTDAVLQTQLEIRDTHGVKVDLRTAAFATAIKRVATVALARGIWP